MAVLRVISLRKRKIMDVLKKEELTEKQIIKKTSLHPQVFKDLVTRLMKEKIIHQRVNGLYTRRTINSKRNSANIRCAKVA